MAAAPDRQRVLHPAPGVLCLYDGRVPGYRFAPEPNWVDAGALELGVSAFAILDGDEALVYDTGTTPAHGRAIRAAVEAAGARRIVVALSHWHLDHVAGNEAFAGCEIVASARTAELLADNREAIEAGTHEGLPGIAPLVAPTRTFEGRAELAVGAVHLELIQFEIHSDDAAVLWWPERRLLFAGDTVEDTVTYVDEPNRLAVHRRELGRLAELAPERVLASHGDPDVLAAGGYGPGIIGATADYIAQLERCRDDPALREAPLRELIAPALERGDLRWFEPYENVHRQNVASILETA